MSPKAYATGIVAVSRPRATSEAINTWRRLLRRSIQAPKWSEKRRFGTRYTVVSAPISPGPACNASTAVSVIAIAEIWSPSSEIDCP